MAEEKKLPLPEKELPAPHDMLLGSSSGSTGQPAANPKTSGTSFWSKYGSKKWLLPLIILIVVLVILVSVVGIMSSSSDNNNNRQNKKEMRQENRENKKENKKKKNKRNKNPNQNKNNKTAAASASVTFTYGTGANRISMRYPGTMKVNITNGVSAVDGTTTIPVITFTDKKNIIKMNLEPNAASLSATNWQAKLSGQNNTYNTPTEAATVAGKPSLIQHTLGTTANWNAYVPMSGTMLWINMNYSGGKNKAQKEFVDMLDTVQIGAQNTTTVPTSLPAANPSPAL